MKDLQTLETELEEIRKETKMKAEAFYQKYKITPNKKNDNCVFHYHQDEEVSYTVFSNKTSNL